MSLTSDLTGLGMPPLLAARLGNNPASLSGTGTTQTGATSLTGGQVLALTPASTATAFVLPNNLSTGRPVYLFNKATGFSASIFPPSGWTINFGATNAGITIPPLSGVIAIMSTGSGLSSGNFDVFANGGGGVGSATPQVAYNAVATAPTANNLALTGANITGGSTIVALNLTAALAAGATATLPTVAALVTAMQAAGLNPVAGASYELDIYNTSSGNFAWTTTTNTGWTLSGTAQTIAQNTFRRYALTLTSLTAATLQSMGQIAFSGAP